MAVEEFGGGPLSSVSERGRRPRRGSLYAVAPTRPTGTVRPGIPAGSTSTATRSGSGTSTASSSSGSGSGGSTSNAYSKAQAAAANRYNRQAKNLEGQARALLHALRVDLKKGLMQQIGDINQVSKQQAKGLREGFRERLDMLEGSAEDNAKAAASQTGINLENQIRERNSAVGEAMAQGAGESDTLNAMMMSLRNWNANQTEIERGYFDSLRSINASKTDLFVDTKTALMNNQVQRNADKEQLWTNYHNQRSELYTQLGNTRGQQADYKAMAAEMKPGKAENLGKGKGKKKGGAGGGYVAAASRAFMQAAKETGKSWNNPGISKKLMKWDGPDDFESTRSGPQGVAEVRTVALDKRPEGATLRKW